MAAPSTWAHLLLCFPSCAREAHDSGEGQIIGGHQPHLLSSSAATSRTCQFVGGHQPHQCQFGGGHQPHQGRLLRRAMMVTNRVRGRYLLLQAVSEGCAAMTLCTQVLALLCPDHWCADERVSALRQQLPLTHLEAKRFSLPPVTIGLPLLQLWTGGNISLAYSQCERYDGDMAAAYVRWMVARMPTHPTGPSLPTQHCDQGWEYNTSAMLTTITMQHDWVCGDSWRPYAVHVIYWIGAGIGSSVFGLAANKFGRYPVLVASVTSVLLGDALTLGLSGFGLGAVLVSRFVAGLGCLALQSISLVHARELCGTMQQEWLLLVAMTSRIVSILLVSAVALVVPSWWFLVLMPALASAACLLLTCRLAHESPWWLLERDRAEDAVKVLQRISARDIKVDRNVLIAMYAAVMHSRNSRSEHCECCQPFTTTDTAIVPTKLCRKHDATLNILWALCGAAYFVQLQAAPSILSMARDSRQTQWDVVLSCWMAAGAELPACVLPHFLQHCMVSHKAAILGVCLSVATLLSACTALIHSSEILSLVLAALNRLSSTSALWVALYLVLQCRVHNTRLTGIVVSMAAFGFGTAVSPIINLLAEYNIRLPYLILAFLNCIGIMLSLTLSRRAINKPTCNCLKEGWCQQMVYLSQYLPKRCCSCPIQKTNQDQLANPIIISSIPYNQLQIV